MFVIYHRVFAGGLIQDTIGKDSTPKDSPILISFSLDGDYTKHEILKSYYKHLQTNKLNWLKPVGRLTEEWEIDLDLLKQSYHFLSHVEYLNGEITIEPEFLQSEIPDPYGEFEDQPPRISSTEIKFLVNPTDVIDLNHSYNIKYAVELSSSIKKFLKDYPNPKECGFLMMKYENSQIQDRIVSELKEIFKSHSLELLRADEKYYSDELLANIKTYMHCCSFGVALFDRINTNYFNPNVSLEIGYIMALKKPILLLKDSTLTSLHSDLVGKLYEEFDFQNSKQTLEKVSEKWLRNFEII